METNRIHGKKFNYTMERSTWIMEETKIKHNRSNNETKIKMIRTYKDNRAKGLMAGPQEIVATVKIFRFVKVVCTKLLFARYFKISNLTFVYIINSGIIG